MPGIACKRAWGLFLIQAMVLLMIVVLIGTLLLRLIYGRHLVLHKANAADEDRQFALGIESRVHACLEGYDFGNKDCESGVKDAGCEYKREIIDGREVTTNVSGTPPDCKIEIEIKN